MPQIQRIDLYQPMATVDGRQPPLVLRIGIPNTQSISEGVPVGGHRQEHYVLLSALPTDLKRRVELAIQSLFTAI